VIPLLKVCSWKFCASYVPGAHEICAAHFTFFDTIIIIVGKNENYEAPHCSVLHYPVHCRFKDFKEFIQIWTFQKFHNLLVLCTVELVPHQTPNWETIPYQMFSAALWTYSYLELSSIFGEFNAQEQFIVKFSSNRKFFHWWDFSDDFKYL